MLLVKTLIKTLANNRQSDSVVYASPSSLNKPYPSSNWIFDSGATSSMTFDPNDFLENSFQSTNGYVTTADGSVLKITGFGDAKFIQGEKTVILSNLKLIPRSS